MRTTAKAPQKPFSAVYQLLTDCDPEAVKTALSIVPPLIGAASPERLAAACQAFLDGRITRPEAINRRRFRCPGVTWAEIDSLRELYEENEKLRRVVQDLFTYIVTCEVPATAQEQQRAA